MIWVWLVLALVVGAVIAFGLAAVVGRESNERPGLLRFDSPGARSALRRCNPDRDVHYFAVVDGDARCECGGHVVPLGGDE